MAVTRAMIRARRGHGRAADLGKFKSPRFQTALTAPYMHDGSLETCDVIDHYSEGVRARSNLDLVPSTNGAPQCLSLSEAEKVALESSFTRSQTSSQPR